MSILNLKILASGHRGFGFVEFEDSRDAQAAMDNMNMSELYGKVIKCSMAKPLGIKEGSVRPSLFFNLSYFFFDFFFLFLL